MANKIVLKKSSVVGRVPTPEDLDYGELALNYADGRLYYKNSSNAIASLGGAQNFVEIDRQSYTAVAGYYTFDIKYSPPYVDVYINGIHLSDEDYTATNGSSITLTEPCNAGDQVDLVGYSGGLISVAPKADGDLLVYNADLQMWENFPQSAVTVGNTDRVDNYHADISNTGETVVVRDVNEFINISGINLTTNDVSAPLVTTSWNSTEATWDFTLKNGVTLQAGQELHVYGRAVGVIPNGSIVMFAGAQGDGILIKTADATTPGFHPSWIVGVATQDLANNEWGYITWFGKVRDINTYGHTLGAILYLDPTSPGGHTDIEPIAPNPKIQVAAVLRVSNSLTSNDGIIMVRPSFAHKLGELQDVYINGVTNKDVLVYNASSSRWENKQLTLGTDTTGNYLATLASSASTIAVTGSGSETAAVNIDLPATGVIAGSYGTASAVPVLTVDIYGRITSASTTAVAGVSGVSYNSSSGVLSIDTSAGTTFTADLGVGTADSPSFTNLSTTGDLTIGGNLIVNGSTTTLNTATLSVDDINITVADGAPNAAAANGAGLTVAGANATITYTSADDRWNLNKNLNVSTVYGALSGNASTASTLQTARTIALSGDVVGSISFNGSSDVTIATAIQPNSVALGTDTTGNYMLNVIAGSGIDVVHTQSEGSTATISHSDTSSVTNLSSDNTGNTFIQDIALTFDTFGHVTGASVATGTVSVGDGTMTVTAGTDLSGGGQVGTANQTGSSSVTVNHADITRTNTTSTASPARNGSFTVVDSVTTNARGHVTGVNTKTVTLPDFEIVSISKSLTLSTTWQDTGISSTDLATGSYMIQIESVSDNTVGGGHYSEYYTGIMSWYSGATNSTVIDEVVLHRAGYAPNSGIIFLRTQRNSAGVLKLQIAASTTNTGAYTYNFKFRRMI
jgi:hypothetical protein